MTIKNFKALKDTQKTMTNQVSLRNEGQSDNDQIEILVGLATCGFAVGADETLFSIEQRIKEENFNAKVVGVGCIGYCHKEPTIQVNIPGKKPTLYGPVTAEMVTPFMQAIMNNEDTFDDHIIETSFDKAVL